MARATRRLVQSRDDHRCTACGASHNLEVHHIVPRRLGGSNDPSNLVTLCSACHGRLHQAPGASPADQNAAAHERIADGTTSNDDTHRSAGAAPPYLKP